MILLKEIKYSFHFIILQNLSYITTTSNTGSVRYCFGIIIYIWGISTEINFLRVKQDAYKAKKSDCTFILEVSKVNVIFTKAIHKALSN